MYTEQVDLKSFDHAYELCYAAKKYMIPSLVDHCSEFIWKDLFPENACRALEFANLYDQFPLKVHLKVNYKNHKYTTKQKRLGDRQKAWSSSDSVPEKQLVIPYSKKSPNQHFS